MIGPFNFMKFSVPPQIF